MPEEILSTYDNFLEDLTIRQQIGNTLGVEHKHECSIPQGCPFSLSLIGLLMRPWIKVMREIGVEPRVLADDLFFTATGRKHATLAVEAMQASRAYFQDIGAKVAPRKCLITSTSQQARANLRKHSWGKDDVNIPVVNHFRDLGAHICFDGANAAPTLTKRLENATDAVNRLARLPITKARKAHIIRTNILPAALYGSEVAEGSKKAMQALRASIANAIGPRSVRRSPAMTFESCSGKGKDLDPMVQRLVRKVTLLRRTIAKHEEVGGKVKTILQKYAKRRMAGTCNDGKNHDVKVQPLGPVGMLIQELDTNGAEIDESLNIKQENEVDFNVIVTPWATLLDLTEALAKRSRTKKASQNRKFFF